MVREEEGSLVLVDISGFTRMSEQLARRGRVGAEEVTDVLGAMFARFLVVARADGAELLKFGGDALLLWFAGDGHPIRATRAAHGMRTTLRSIGAVETTAGRVTLRMSIGVHSGRFQFFLVGGSHRELLVAGPAATETVRMEAAAMAGEILLSPATAAHLPARLVGRAKGPGRILRAPPPERVRESSDTGMPAALPDLEPYVPVALRECIRAGTEPEHRSATVAFVHFDGTDEIIERDGPDAAAAALDELVRDVQAAVDDHAVCFLASDIDAHGGKLILTAGVPRLIGDDEERMLLALRRIVEGERRLPVRVGVNRGPVFAGDVGPPNRRTYTVMGDPVNLAARLMARAAPGQILATEGVLESSSARFETHALEPFMVKGKARPVSAWVVGSPIRRPRHTAADDLPFTGRDEELGFLAEALDAARSGHRRTVVIRGEAGIGKTRLLDEVLGLGADFEVFGATGESFTSATPYVAWRDVLRSLIGASWDEPAPAVVARLRDAVERHDPGLLPWLPLIATAADAETTPTPEVSALAPEYRRPRLHDAVIGLLRALSTRPMLVAFEDAHLMDEPSASLLEAIVTDRRIDRPWLILALRRPGGAGFAPADDDRISVLDLAPLASGATRALATVATADAPLPERVLTEAVERSTGNPQLLLDLIHAAASGDSSMPDSVEAAATVRIDALAPHDRQLVRRVSVFGLAFHPRFLPDVLGEGMPAPTSRTWERLADFFEPEADGYLRFRRAVIRDAAYAGLPFGVRRRLHAAIGAHWERETADPDDIAGLLSLHFSLGGSHERAWRYARMAAERAARVFANVEAAILYRRALDAAQAAKSMPASEMAAVAEARAEALYLAGEFGEAAESLVVARRLAGDDPGTRARLLIRRAWIEEKRGRFSNALRLATRARRTLEGIEGIEASRLRADQGASYASFLQAEGRSREAIAWAVRAVVEAEESENREALARALNALDWARLQIGEPTGDAWGRAFEIYRDLGDLAGQAGILSNLGAQAFYAGRWDEALGLAEQGRAIQLRIGNYVGAAVDATNMAELRSEQGAYDVAEPLLRDAIRVARAAGHPWGIGLSQSVLALTLARTGRFDEALRLFEHARAEWERIGAGEDIALNEARRAECHVLMGDGERALAIADELFRPGHASDETAAIVPQLERVRGYALAQTANLPAAHAALARSLAAARARDDLLQIALSLTAITRLDRHEGREPDADVAEEASATLARLDIRHVPEVPLP